MHPTADTLPLIFSKVAGRRVMPGVRWLSQYEDTVMNKFLEIASNVSTPLALGGIFAAIFFFVMRQILAKNIFPSLTKQLSSDIIKLIINRLFVLSLIAMVLGFIGYAITLGFDQNKQNIPPRPKPADLLSIMEDLTKPHDDRLKAFLMLRDEFGVKDFRKRNLSGLKLPSYGWENVDFREATLRNVDLQNANLRGVDFVRADMQSANLESIDLRGGHLNGANLSNANCKRAVFTEVMLRYGTYIGTNFEHANLDDTNMALANFTNARFNNATLRNADLNDAKLQGADFSGASGLDTAYLARAIYDDHTLFPPNFVPKRSMIKEKR